MSAAERSFDSRTSLVVISTPRSRIYIYLYTSLYILLFIYYIHMCLYVYNIYTRLHLCQNMQIHTQDRDSKHGILCNCSQWRMHETKQGAKEITSSVILN